MKIHIKNRADGNTIHLEVGAKCTVGELRTKICSEFGHQNDPQGIRIFMGEDEISSDDAAILNDAGIVSGDMLFLEMGASTSAPTQNAQNPVNEQSREEQDVEMQEDNGFSASVMLRDRVIRAARDYMEDSGYSNNSLQTWNSTSSSGAELEFERRTRTHTSNIFVLITALQRPNPSAVVNVGRIVDSSRNLLSSFTVQPASVKDNIINGIAIALSGSAATGITLIHLFSLNCIREQVLRNMEPRSVVRLSGVNRLLRSILHSPSVDRTYWMQRLSSDFGTAKVQQAQQAGRSFRNVYAEEYAARKLAQQQNPLLLESPFNPIRGGGGPPNVPFQPGPRGPYAPYPPVNPRAPDPPRHPDPLFPAPDPLQPIPDPNPLVVPPRVNPYRPGAPFNPDPFDPFDPDNREIFPGRPNQGVPRGGPRYFPANRWDRGNDYI